MSTLLDESTRARPNPRQEAAAGVKGARRRGRTLAWARGIAGVLVLLAVWEVAPRLELVNSRFVPPISVVLETWWEMLGNGKLWTHFSASISRSLIGFSLALVVAVPLGAAIAWYTPVRQFFTPVLEIFRNTAALALLPVFVMVLGIGETSKIAIVAFACFFPILLNTISGVSNVDEQLLRTAKVLGLSPLATFVKVVFPAAVSTIFVGIRIAAEAAIIVLIAAEMIGATAGLGFLINYAQYNFLIPQMYAGIIAITMIGVAVNYGLVGIEKRLSRWKG